MSKEEYDRILAATREVTQQAAKSKETAIAFLQRAGLVDENGQLAKPYASSSVINANSAQV
jgi:hypothetical protein